MVAFFITHLFMLIYGIFMTFHSKEILQNSIAIDPTGYIVIIAALLSLLRLSIGRNLIRYIAFFLLCFDVFFPIIYGTFTWIRILDLLFWGYIYLSFGKRSWWYDLYKPIGIFTKN